MKDAIEKLDEHVVGFTAEVKMLRHEVKNQRRYVRWAIGLALLAILTLGPNVYFLYRLDDIASTNQDNGEIAKRNSELLVECTTPSTPNDPHPCYDRGQEQTGKAIQQIICALKPEAPGCPVVAP